MVLDLTKLKNVKRRGSNIIARCPACAESEGDRKGEHLFINDKGQFGCVLYPGAAGRTHRQRIFELVGVKESPGKGFAVRRLLPLNKNDDNIQGGFKKPIPSVLKPTTERQNKIIFTPEEELLLAGIDAESLNKVRMIKIIFGGTVVAVEDNICEDGQDTNANQKGGAL